MGARSERELSVGKELLALASSAFIRVSGGRPITGARRGGSSVGSVSIDRAGASRHSLDPHLSASFALFQDVRRATTAHHGAKHTTGCFSKGDFGLAKASSVRSQVRRTPARLPGTDTFAILPASNN